MCRRTRTIFSSVPLGILVLSPSSPGTGDGNAAGSCPDAEAVDDNPPAAALSKSGIGWPATQRRSPGPSPPPSAYRHCITAAVYPTTLALPARFSTVSPPGPAFLPPPTRAARDASVRIPPGRFASVGILDLGDSLSFYPSDGEMVLSSNTVCKNAKTKYSGA